MSNAIYKIKEGLSELDNYIEDIDTHCNYLETKVKELETERDNFLIDLSRLIDKYRKDYL